MILGLFFVFFVLPEQCPQGTGWMRCGWGTGWGPAGCVRLQSHACTPWWVQYASFLEATEPHSMGRSPVGAWIWSLHDDHQVGTEPWGDRNRVSAIFFFFFCLFDRKIFIYFLSASWQIALIFITIIRTKTLIYFWVGSRVFYSLFPSLNSPLTSPDNPISTAVKVRSGDERIIWLTFI